MDTYESYEEFLIDYVKYMAEEEKRSKKIIEENKRDVEYLRRKLALEQI